MAITLIQYVFVNGAVLAPCKPLQPLDLKP